MSDERLTHLVNHLLGLRERDWLEFKLDNSDPKRIGTYVSAMANAAALHEEPFGYVLWGVEDETRQVVGTTFDPATARRGNVALEFWLTQVVDPMPHVEFLEFNHSDGRLVIMKVAAATQRPVRFEGRAFIRIGDATPELASNAELERRLWTVLQSYRWEEGVALGSVTADQVTELLDVGSYFRLLGQPLPETRDDVLNTLKTDRVIAPEVGQRWNILNLGAILFAHSLSDFGPLSRKGVRIIRYVGDTRKETVKERAGARGYARSFEALIVVVDAHLPKRERIGRALREEYSPFSELSIRELVANAIVHQDMTISGAGPMVEIFDNRVEITNPGRPLVAPDRFIDSPPRSRNEAMAALMRRMNICEERGSGIDKVVMEAEENRLPPPSFLEVEGSVRVTLYGPRTFAEMTPTERVRGCFQHTILRWLEGKRATNSSLRERFGVASANAAQISRVFRQASELGLIKLFDSASPRSGYVPAWA